MTNAKNEILKFTKGKQIKCALITTGREWMDADERKNIVLKVGHTETDYQRFLAEMDFEYDSGYGGQELFGNIWFEDNTWADRGEYDGSEWWQHQCLPEIPKELL